MNKHTRERARKCDMGMSHEELNHPTRRAPAGAVFGLLVNVVRGSHLREEMVEFSWNTGLGRSRGQVWWLHPGSLVPVLMLEHFLALHDLRVFEHLREHPQIRCEGGEHAAEPMRRLRMLQRCILAREQALSRCFELPIAQVPTSMESVQLV